jgi:hypothetical protein
MCCGSISLIDAKLLGGKTLGKPPVSKLLFELIELSIEDYGKPKLKPNLRAT